MKLRLGVHQFKNYPGSSSFFIQRQFGNFIFFADLLQDMDYEFLKSRGGIYKIFINSPNDINQTHIDIFDRFGATAVYSNGEPGAIHPKIPLEKLHDEFSDPSLQWNLYPDLQSVVVEQRGKRIIFFGKEVRLDHQLQILVGDENLTDSISSFLKKEHISLAFFSRHEGHAILEPHSSQFIERIRAKFFSGKKD